MNHGAKDVLRSQKTTTALYRIDTNTFQSVNTNLTFLGTWLHDIKGLKFVELVSCHFFCHHIGAAI